MTTGGAMNTDRIISAAESLADAVEDFLYSEESDRNALRDAWLHYVGVADDE